ncbi:phosphoribosylaminoimidazole-succinocarboxamide synthase [Pseudogymnoascus sp. 24MN13]|nr:phosphoribosylaminoimidazole-succinocarboxamide synthase [Pseudogymnoascus sp. 24MN13]
MADPVLTSSSIEGLPKIAEGKVRDLYEVDEKTLLFVASDRISAYDVIMKNGVPSKGALLTLLSSHWFSVLPTLVPGLRTHFVTLDLPPSVPESQRAALRNRSMQVRKFKIFPIEAIVRGYITAGLKEAEPFPQGAIYTPSTKAEAGANDENIHPSEAAKIVGEKYAARIEELALSLYKAARDYAYERGIIIADTKFEFGLDEETDEVVLVDEVLTPDSSRFWPKDKYEVGRDQESYDKQYLRNWLTAEGVKGKQGVAMPQEIVDNTKVKYVEAYELLTGKKWGSA